MIGGRWEENGRGYEGTGEGTGEDAMERGDRLWYWLLFSTGAKEYFRHRLIYPVTKREAIGRGFGVPVQKPVPMPPFNRCLRLYF